ncbi:unnamed protein product [Commensalibacter communis]|uniref:Uncharacterized protein n=1 Tax=Commensalibacter communis TaxID=2972786 RepID=A0A9W4TPR0_9PROT|nr:hypothetical protein [Commensalibacter communis]CAI3950476.1 unnamed protein product [Commensalibacter communis]CAI3950686.1 unnamed protein product [Commensalibacter communis]CAI3952606.1 unnamed protein product [Commensalibacter communis]CAI3954455.1 unnamed protein product [Commensalibacter communis]CAI3954565.1 unnamed protein product [Commensalibacter communis]
MVEYPIWVQSNQEPVACKEKIKILNENYAELRQMMQDSFEDAMIMGVDEQAMRNILKQIVDQLRSPMV